MKPVYVVYCLNNGNMTSDIIGFLDEKLAIKYCNEHSNSEKNIYYFYNMLYISDYK